MTVTPDSRSNARLRWLLVVFVALGLWSPGPWNFSYAQTFNANTYYQQCLRFEAGGDLETAKQSCLNAIQIDPNLTDAQLALGRIDRELGNLAEAASRLEPIARAVDSAEPYILLAEIAIERAQYVSAESYLRQAQTRLQARFNSEFDARRRYLSGLLAEMRGDYNQALESYQTAIAADSLETTYRLANASLRFTLGEAGLVIRELEQYQTFIGASGGADLLALLARARWAEGDYEGAANAFESALITRSARDTEALQRDLRDRTLVYFGQGDFRSGSLALQAAAERGNLLPQLLGALLPWIVLLLLLFALHLVGESMVDTTSSLEIIEGPRLWTVGQVYATLFTAALIAIIATLGYGYLQYQNFLAIVTPIQSADVRAFFLTVVSLLLAFLAYRQVRANGWKPFEVLLGGSSNIPLGIGVGVGLLVGIVAYKVYVPEAPWSQSGDFYLGFARLTPLFIAAVVAIPLGELYFRAFVIPPLSQRYVPGLGIAISGVLYGLVLGVPLLLVVLVGAVLGEVFRRYEDGITLLVAQLVVHLGLVLGVTFNDWMRSVFLL